MSNVVDMVWESFHPNEMRNVYGPILIIGKSGCGKNRLLENLLYHRHDEFALAIAFTQTADVNPDLSRFMPSGFIYKDIDDELVKNVFVHAKQRYFERQAQNTEALAVYDQERQIDPDMASVNLKRRLQEINTKKGILFIFDDMTSTKKALNYTPSVRSLFTEGRHYDICSIVLMQDPLTTQPDLRGNARFVFAYQQDGHRQVKNLFENYFSCFGTEKAFSKTFPELTRNFQCIVARLMAGSANGDLESRVAAYKAPEFSERFVLGNADYWETHAQEYDPDANMRTAAAANLGAPPVGGYNRSILNSKSPVTIVHRTAYNQPPPNDTLSAQVHAPPPQQVQQTREIPPQDRAQLEQYLAQRHAYEQANFGTVTTTWQEVENKYWDSRRI